MKILKQSLVIFVLGSIPFFYFCKSPKDIVQKEFELQQVHDTIAYLDLSHKGLTELPQKFESLCVKKLNLSHNELTTLDFNKLPAGLEVIDISYNDLNGYIFIGKRRGISDINLSNNKIDSLFVYPIIKNIDVSNNELIYLYLNVMSGHHVMDNLDISNNKDFDNVILFEPQVFKEIHRKNIKNNKPLKFRGFFGGAGCTAEDIFIKSKE